MGNICRSPTAEGVFRQVWAQHAPACRLEVDSAGTHAYHIGEPPDRRSQAAARSRGIDLSMLRARQVRADDFAAFDLILAMDRDNLRQLQRICPPALRSKLGLFLDFAADLPVDEVPDPYYGGEAGFETVLDLTERAAQGLMRAVQQGAVATSSATQGQPA
jgi:protein-tyrosine phosphatase